MSDIQLENAKQETMSFLGEVIPPACWIITYNTLDFFSTVINEGGRGVPELPCMTGNYYYNYYYCYIIIITNIAIIIVIITIIILILIKTKERCKEHNN